MKFKGQGTGNIAIVFGVATSIKIHSNIVATPDELKLIKGTFQQAGGDPNNLYYTFAQHNSRQLSAEEFHQRHEELVDELEARDIQKILALGDNALALLTNNQNKPNVLKYGGRAFETLLPSGRKVYSIACEPPHYVTTHPDYYREFCAAIRKLLKNQKVFQFPKCIVTICETIDEVAKELRKLRFADALSCDLETEGFDAHVDKILSIGFALLPMKKFDDTARSVIIPHKLLPEVKPLFIEFFKQFRGRLIFHNAKFDLKFLYHYLGKDLITGSWGLEDTMLMNYLIDERPVGGANWTSPHSLKTLAKYYFDSPDYKIDLNKFLKMPEDKRPYMELFKYQAMDTLYTAALWYKLNKVLEAEEEPGLWNVYRNLLIPGSLVFMEMEYYGTPVDREYLLELDTKLEKQLTKVRVEVQDLLVRQFGSAYTTFNPNSPAQVAKVWYDLFELPDVNTKIRGWKSRSTGKATLAWHLDLHRKDADYESLASFKFLMFLKEHRELAKIRSTYTSALYELSALDGCVHPDFRLNGAVTGRLSCTKPNLQNQPARMGNTIRKAFIAPEGFKFVSADYSQLELRVGALISKDVKMREAFVADRDIHKEVAAAMFNVPYDKVTKEQRHFAKYVVFGSFYGRGASSVAAVYGYTIQHAQQLIDNFLNQFPELKKYMHDIQQQAWTQHFVSTATGRLRRFPLITPMNKAEIGRQALNAPVQGLASDLCLNALILLHRRLQAYPRCRLLFTVHDSIAVIVPEEEIEVVVEIIRDTMENNLPIITDVPMKVDIEVSQRWGEAK